MFLPKHPQHEGSDAVGFEGGRNDDVVARVQLKATAHFTEVNVDATLSTVRGVAKMSGRKFGVRRVSLQGQNTIQYTRQYNIQGNTIYKTIKLYCQVSIH